MVFLNDEQRRAVECDSSRVLVIAPAGTGKTRVLTERIIHLIENENIDPNRILAITFTNFAASEMKERISKRIKRSYKIPASIGTIHSIFVEIVRRDIEKICSDRDHNFEILSENDQVRFLRQAAKNIGLKSKFGKFQLLALRDLFSEWKHKSFLNIEVEIEKDNYGEMFNEYVWLLKNKNSVDYDDILILASQILDSDESIRSFWRNRFEAICIDECQDLNEIQFRLIKKIFGDDCRFFAVGDPNQCIYIFNGAKENIFEEIKEAFNPEIVELEVNYRSGRLIVNEANLIRQVKGSDSRSNRDFDGEIRICDSLDGGIIDCMLKDKNLSNWAILFPKNSDIKLVIETLIDHEVDFKVSKLFLLEDQKISRIANFFKAIFFDSAPPLRSLILSLEYLPEHVKKELVDRENIPKNTSLKEYLLDGCEWRNCHVSKEELDEAGKVIEEIKRIRGMKGKLLSELVPDIVNVLFKDSLSSSDEKKVELFRKWLKMIQKKLGEGNAEEIVLDMKGYAEFSRDELVGDSRNNSLTLSTIHKTKGLEWENVIVLKYDSLKEEAEKKTDNRFLEYVAITRARNRLFLIRNE